MLKYIKVMVILMVIFCLSTMLMAGTTGKISGRITDTNSGDPLAGVNVVVEGTSMGAATDIEGDYFIINVPPGTYTVEARMIGYTTQAKSGVVVNIDRTITVDFAIQQTVLEGQEVTVVAEREIVPMDVSASSVVAEAREIMEVPLVQGLDEFVNLQVGVEDDLIRGGGLDQTQFVMDGLVVVDNRTNEPMMMVNLSAIEELNIIKGGFNAEYGNLRSGLINVVTKEGSSDEYHGSVDFRYTPARQKHFGPSVYSPDNYLHKAYLDPAVCYVGTENGTWDEYTQLQNVIFMGWNAFVETLPEGQAMTPQEARDLYIWEHLIEGCEELGQKPKQYGNKPDMILDVGFGGPVPLIGEYLGDLSFFFSYKNDWEAYTFPTTKDYFKNQTTSLKLTSRISGSMKLGIEGLYGDVSTVFNSSRTFMSGTIRSGSWNPMEYADANVYRSLIGFSFDHVLSPRTFYNIRVSYVNNNNTVPIPDEDRDFSIVKNFGLYGIDERPWGVVNDEVNTMNGDRAGGFSWAWDFSSSRSINIKGDLTSQFDKYNQIKTGFTFDYDDIDENRGYYRKAWPVHNWSSIWTQSPYRIGAYIQDKIEFEGMITNVGIRLDYNEPNTEWFSSEDRYSKYYSKTFKDQFEDKTPRESAEGHVKISPRLGVSHPISENAKLYFNYGHFYSMPSSYNMYTIRYGGDASGITAIGNPSAEMPRTVSYELGLEYDLMNMFLIHLAGYYKDARHQTGAVNYQNYSGSVNYQTWENNNFSDTRGFELRIDKRWGKWITGWINYNYMVTSSGYIGRATYYEDLRLQLVQGLQPPQPDKPLARPLFRGNITLRTPPEFGPGPTIGGTKILGDLSVSLVYQWKAGEYSTWDPLGTMELVNNIQWKSIHSLDMRISKRMGLGQFNFQLFVDINNPFNWKNMSTYGFTDGTDQQRYLRSLHLPMYEGAEYQAQGFTPGDDTPGDIRSDEKPYIDDPNMTHLTYFDVREIIIGINVSF